MLFIRVGIKNRVGDDGGPPILQYRPSDLYLTDRKETMAILQKGTHTPLHGLLFNHPSTSYCSSTPPPSTVHPALHGVVMFIQPSTGSCSSSPNRLDRSGSCSSTPTGNCSSKLPSNAHFSTHPPPQQRSLFIQRQHRSASVSSSSEGIARSGSVNSHRSIAHVQ